MPAVQYAQRHFLQFRVLVPLLFFAGYHETSRKTQLIRKLMIAGALAAFIACSGDGGTNPNVVTNVEVTASPTQISVNGTSQATAVAKNGNGGIISGKTATWQSLTPTVAGINSNGVITGVAAGTATIQATIDGINGTTTVSVISAVSACNSGLTTVDLAPGEVRTLTSASTQGCIKVSAATSAAADYLVIPSNLSSLVDVVSTYAFKSDQGDVVPANRLATTVMTDASQITSSNALLNAGALQSGFEKRLRLTERRELRLPAAQAAYRSRRNGAIRYAQSVAIPAVGDRQTFKVPGQTNSCNNYKTITAEAKFINEKVIIFSDVASPPGGFTNTDFQQIADEFRDLIYPTDVAYFGTPLDLDANQRIIILYTPEVNKLTEAGNPSSFVGGFFWAGDLFPTTAPNPKDACPQSNLAELFYLLAPDPTGSINGNIRNTKDVRQGTRGTIAHEFQHMINASERIRSPIDQPLEDVWLDEGLAHFAEDAVGRVVRGIGEADDATFARTLGGNVDDFNAFFFQNFSRFRLYLTDPGFRSPASDDFGGDSLSFRGAAWALLHYAADQYAPGGDIKAFTRKLAGGPDIGIANLTKNASGVAWDVLISGFLIANYADNLGIPNLNSLYTYKVYDMRSNESALPASGGVYPLKLNTITSASYAASNLKARSGSGNYFFISRPLGTAARTFRFLNPDGVTAASFTGASWVLLRTR
jgi:hypothetical protein